METVFSIIAGVFILATVILNVMVYLKSRTLYDKLDTAKSITVED